MEGETAVSRKISDFATNHESKTDVCSDQPLSKLETLEKKALHLKLILEKDYQAADLKWSLFVAAAFSFRYDSCLRPFPSAFLKCGIKDMDELVKVIGDVPALDLVLQQLDEVDNYINSAHVIDLLFYVLVRLKEPSLKTVPTEGYKAVLSQVNTTVEAAKPQYIFQVVSTTRSSAENKWRELSKGRNTFYAYHGSRLENFYSILHFGLQQHMNKNSLFGSGIYLSSELSVSLPYSHGGFGWGGSCLGSHLSCVAMCELIDAPEGINYKKPILSEGDAVLGEEGRKRGSDKSEVPQAYYVVSNSDLVRVRYLLVYAKQPVTTRVRAPIASKDSHVIRRWISRHKLFSILLGYGLMLATIGITNNQPIQIYCKALLKKLEVLVNSIKS